MQLFTITDVLSTGWIVLNTIWQLKGIISEAATNLVLLPFHEFTMASCLIASVLAVLLWKNKGWLVNGISHLLDISGKLHSVIK